MASTQLIYLIFGAVLLVALIIDLGLLSKSNSVITGKMALVQTVFWVSLALAFCCLIWYENGQIQATRFISAYFLEWSLSIDNIFVFIIIFSYFKVPEVNHPRVLLLGILMAIVFRIVFITAGTELVAHFNWIMYVFGGLLFITGVKMFMANKEKQFSPESSWAYRLLIRIFRTTKKEAGGRFIIKINHKYYLTRLAMVVIMLGLIDIAFAIDSIPAVFSIIPDPRMKLLIYSSNIFAVLGLRSLFFLLHGAANRFDYLQQGIAVVLLFIGAKMLVEKWIEIPVWASLMVIVVCIGGSILYSLFNNNTEKSGS